MTNSEQNLRHGFLKNNNYYLAKTATVGAKEMELLILHLGRHVSCKRPHHTRHTGRREEFGTWKTLTWKTLAKNNGGGGASHNRTMNRLDNETRL